MSNHAHGPWEIEYDDLTEEWIVSWETGSAEVGGLYAADQARLIAAAPDMLDALKAAAHVLPLGEEYDAAVEAVAKAKGETE